MATAADLIGEIRQLCDISGSAFYADYDLLKMVNKSLSKLQSIMVNSYDGSYFVQTGSYDVTTVASQQDYDISSLNPWKVVSVSYNDGSFDYICQPAPWSDRHDSQLYTELATLDNISPYRYLLFGNRLKLIPAPPASKTIKIWHIPRWSNLTAVTDTIDAQIPEQYLDYAIADVAIKVKTKSEESIQEVMAIRQDTERLIREDAENRITKQVRYAPDVNDDLPFWFRSTN